MAFKISLFDNDYDCIGSGCMSLDFIRYQLDLAAGDDVEVDISSLGGSHFDAVAIYDLLKKYPGLVTTICVAVAGSAASTVFAAGKKRIMSKYGLLMIHPANIVTAGDSKSIISDASMLDKCTENVIQIWADVSGLEYDKVAEMVNETTWLSSDEALALNFCTDVEDYSSDAEPVKNAAVVMNKIQSAPTKYKQVINHILVKQPETAQTENTMTKEEIEAIVNKNDGVLAKVMNFLKLSTNKLTTNKGEIFFVGNLKAGTKVYNSADMDTEVENANDIEVEDSASAKKVKMEVENGAVKSLVENTVDDPDKDDDMDEEDLDAENKAANVKAVMNSHGIQLKKSVGAKKVMNATMRKLVEVTNKYNQGQELLQEAQANLVIANAEIKKTRDEVKDEIITSFKPTNSTRESRSTITETVPNIKKPAPGSTAEKAMNMAVKNAK